MVDDRGRDGGRKRFERFRDLAGFVDDVAEIMERLAVAESAAHLIGVPSGAPPPPGCGVAFNVIRVNPDPDKGEVFRPANGGGKLALSRPALLKIAGAMGIAWDPSRSMRLDDGSDPRYCRFVAVGMYRAIDGSIRDVVAEKQLDLREGSDTCKSIIAHAREGKDPHAQIRDMRLFIQEHAETKARMRAIRDASGVRSYAPEELQRPFVVPRLVFTGSASDPAVAREIALLTAQSFLGARSALYGASAPARVLPPPAPRLALATIDATPSRETIRERDDDDRIPDENEAPRLPAGNRSNGSTADEDRTLAFGRGGVKGKRFGDVSLRDLRWYADTLEKSLDNPDKARWRDDNEAALEAARRVIARREQDTPGDYSPSDEADLDDDHIPY